MSQSSTLAKPTLSITCPYCAARLETATPPAGDNLTSVECVPYTRDIGRFDPKSEGDWFAPSGWSRIGKDYLPLVNWEYFGILRLRNPELHVEYRVQACSVCRRFFDVYANYTGRPLSWLWPHLFPRPGAESEFCTQVPGDSWLVHLTRRAGAALGHPLVGALVLPVVLLAICSLPLLTTLRSGSRAQVVLAKISLGTGVAGAIGAGVALALILRYLSSIKNLDDLGRLLRVTRRDQLAHWRNYTICRLVGVQGSGSRPSFSQIDVVVGLAAVLALLGAVVVSKGGWLALLRTVAATLAVVSLEIQILRVARKTRTNRQRRLTWLLSAVPLLALAVWGAMSLQSRAIDTWDLTFSVTSMLFWAAVLFVLGVSAWIAMNSTVYIFAGLSRIPMKTTPYDGFFSLRLLRRVQGISTGLMLATFLTMLAIMSVLAVFESTSSSAQASDFLSYPSWLTGFMLVVVAAVLVSLAAGSGRPLFVYLCVIYLALASFAGRKTITILGTPLSVHLFLISLFFAGLIAYQSAANERILRRIVRESKLSAATALSDAIGAVTGSADFSARLLPGMTGLTEASGGGGGAADLLVKLNGLLRLVDNAKPHPSVAMRLLSLAAPLVTSTGVQIATRALMRTLGW